MGALQEKEERKHKPKVEGKEKCGKHKKLVEIEVDESKMVGNGGT